MKTSVILIAITLLFSQTAVAADCVVLLHGLGRTKYSMRAIERELRKEGYLTVNNSYPSRQQQIDKLTEVVEKGIIGCNGLGAREIHFVTHSLGGILVRNYFQEHVVRNAAKVVMLSPPNHGSEVVDKYRYTWWFRAFTGPAGLQLGTGPDALTQALGRIPLDVGIIAGTKSLDPWFSKDLPKPNDGKVTVSSAKLPEMKDFVTVPNGHTFICSSKIVISHVKYFLVHGHFDHSLRSS